jgi:hypothetical protein
MTLRSASVCSPIRPTIALAALFLLILTVPAIRASEVGIGVNASAYAVLCERTGGHNLSITNVTVNGNVGVGGTGVVQLSGPWTTTGPLDSAASSGQYHNTNAANVGPTSVNFGVAAVTAALNNVNRLNSRFTGLVGTP